MINNLLFGFAFGIGAGLGIAVVAVVIHVTCEYLDTRRYNNQ